MSGYPALFLDRDGVINEDHGYVYLSQSVRFLPGIFELVRRAFENGYLIIVVTNQAGIGRGYYTEADFLTLTTWMDGVFREHSAVLDAVYFCPDHPDHGVGEYRRHNSSRKPGPGMLLAAVEDFGVDLRRSILVGDSVTDMLAANEAGVGKAYLMRGADMSGVVGATLIADFNQIVLAKQDRLRHSKPSAPLVRRC